MDIQNAITILLVEDNPGDARLIFEMLANKSEIAITHVGRLAKGIEEVQAKSFDIILLDLSLPDSYGLDTINRMKAAAPHTAIVVLTGLDDDCITELAIRAGAQDYLPKEQLDSSLLLRSIRYSIERNQTNAELEKKVIERTHQLQDINTALEEEIMERQSAQGIATSTKRRTGNQSA